MLQKRRSVVRLAVSFVLILAFLGTGLWLLFNRQFVLDQMSVWNYQPTTEISELTSQLAMEDKGKFYFYASHPKIETAEEFNGTCPQQEKNNPILGCYTSQRIFIYDVDNNSLDGIQQVTAAHEMLHAAWERMGEGERSRLSTLLQAEYDKSADDEMKERMEYYERTQPGQFYNELHSIIATEYEVIGEELEKYYAQYFRDRQVIVNFYNEYSGVFKDLERQSESLYSELTRLDDQIATLRSAYTSAATTLSSDIADFNRRATNGEFTSQAQFDNERSVLVTRSNQLEADRVILNSLIDTYNKKYEEYREVASHIRQLNESIDSMSSAPEAPAVE